MNEIMYIGGITGTGKSYLLTELQAIINDRSINLCDFSSLLRGEFRRSTGQDDFRGCERTDSYRHAVDSAVAKLFDLQPVLVAGHYFIRTPEGRYVYEKPFIEIAPCVAFLHLVCRPETLVQRLLFRERVTSTSAVSEDLEFSSEVALRLSQQGNTSLYTLQNDCQEDLRTNIRFIIELWRNAGVLGQRGPE